MTIILEMWQEPPQSLWPSSPSQLIIQQRFRHMREVSTTPLPTKSITPVDKSKARFDLQSSD